MSGWRWRLRTWSPDYDAPRAPGRAVSAPRVDAGVEVVPRSWAPIRPVPSAGEAGPVAFVDGVQRIDAWADLDGPDGERSEALFASVAAGAVRVVQGGQAMVVDAQVRRLLIGGPPEQPPVSTARGDTYHPHVLSSHPHVRSSHPHVRSSHPHLLSSGAGRSAAPDDQDPEVSAPSAEGTALEVALQVARDGLEVEVAAAAAEEAGALVVVDGPLHHRDHLSGAVGYVKSHRVEYLTDPWLRRVVTGLAPGERTPLFQIDSGWTRWSWYSRLPVSAGRADGFETSVDQLGWAGLVRGEASGRLDLAEAGAWADRSTWTVARFASSPVKDSRAPQNLVPVGGLERILRHRLGERELLERSLRAVLSG